MSEVLLDVRNLKKYFKTRDGLLYAVDDVSFTLKEGETLGLVGESGCGKSTTGRAILRLHEPTGGYVGYKGRDIIKCTKKEMRDLRKEMQIVFQDPYSSLNPRKNVRQLIGTSLHVNRIGNKVERIERIKEIMDVVGLEQRLLNSYPHELDGGRRQRIGIARALILNPSFVVMDEPVSALDVCIQAQILNLLMKLQDKYKFTYLFISHNLSVVRHISDHIAVMYLGKIVEVSDYRTLFSNPLHPYTKALLSSITIPKLHVNKERFILSGDVPSPINPPAGCRFRGRCPYAKPECGEYQPELKKRGDSYVACHLYQ